MDGESVNPRCESRWSSNGPCHSRGAGFSQMDYTRCLKDRMIFKFEEVDRFMKARACVQFLWIELKMIILIHFCTELMGCLQLSFLWRFCRHFLKCFSSTTASRGRGSAWQKVSKFCPRVSLSLYKASSMSIITSCRLLPNPACKMQSWIDFNLFIFIPKGLSY